MSEQAADSLWQQQYRQLASKLSLRRTDLKLAGQALEWFEVADEDAVLAASIESELAEAYSGETNPFWAGVWRSALGLDLFLDRVQLQDIRVLEFGCGTGRGGMAAALRGARVTFTDAVENAVSLARLNTWSVRQRCSYQVLDWTKSRACEEPFPVLLGSDLAYEPELFRALVDCVGQFLAKDGVFYLAEPGRRSGSEFIDFMHKHGWHSECTKVPLHDGLPPIQIHSLQR